MDCRKLNVLRWRALSGGSSTHGSSHYALASSCSLSWYVCGLGLKYDMLKYRKCVGQDQHWECACCWLADITSNVELPGMPCALGNSTPAYRDIVHLGSNCHLSVRAQIFSVLAHRLIVHQSVYRRRVSIHLALEGELRQH